MWRHCVHFVCFDHFDWCQEYQVSRVIHTLSYTYLIMMRNRWEGRKRYNSLQVYKLFSMQFFVQWFLSSTLLFSSYSSLSSMPLSDWNCSVENCIQLGQSNSSLCFASINISLMPWSRNKSDNFSVDQNTQQFAMKEQTPCGTSATAFNCNPDTAFLNTGESANWVSRQSSTFLLLFTGSVHNRGLVILLN